MLLHGFRRLLVEGWGSGAREGSPLVPQELGLAVTKHTEPHSRLETKTRGVLDAALVLSLIFTVSYMFKLVDEAVTKSEKCITYA